MLEFLALMAANPTGFDLAETVEPQEVEVAGEVQGPLAPVPLSPRSFDDPNSPFFVPPPPRDETGDELREEARKFRKGFNERRIAFHVLNALDLATSLYCVNEIEGCHEANPILGDSQTALIGGKILASVLYEVLLPPDIVKKGVSRKQAKTVQWVAIGIMGTVVGWNATVIF